MGRGDIATMRHSRRQTNCRFQGFTANGTPSVSLVHHHPLHSFHPDRSRSQCVMVSLMTADFEVSDCPLLHHAQPVAAAPANLQPLLYLTYTRPTRMLSSSIQSLRIFAFRRSIAPMGGIQNGGQGVQPSSGLCRMHRRWLLVLYLMLTAVQHRSVAKLTDEWTHQRCVRGIPMSEPTVSPNQQRAWSRHVCSSAERGGWTHTPNNLIPLHRSMLIKQSWAS